jgi:methylmalonyl-CoA/ethylmalonyl-CoA epimerase
MVGSEKIELKQAVQVCVVVKDIQKAMERYWNLGIGPWAIYTFQSPELTNTTFQGKPAKYSMKLAIAMIGSVMWELIEPLEGPSSYKEFLAQKGEGLHHVLLAVDNYDQTITAFEQKGIGVLMKGDWKGLTYAYLDTEKELGAILEIFKPLDWAPPEPEAIYPPSTPQKK